MFVKLKKIVCTLIAVLLIASSFSGCSKKNDNVSPNGNQDNVNNYVNGNVNNDAGDNAINDANGDANNDINNNSAPQSDTIEPNSDGILELSCYTKGYFTPEAYNKYKYYSDDESSNPHISLVLKHADMRIMKIDKSKTVGIYDNYESLNFYPITRAAKYTIPFCFQDNSTLEGGVHEIYGFRDYIDGFGSSGDNFTTKWYAMSQLIDDNETDNGDYQYTNLKIDLKGLAEDTPITECNGEDLTTYLSKNSSIYYINIFYPMVNIYKYVLLNAQKNDKVTLGGYVGTDWVEVEFPVAVEYYELNDVKPVVVNKTKNGYFTVDLTSFSAGIYFVEELETFIELI